MSLSKLFEPVRLGDLQLTNRIVMAPMTRNRADADGTPNAQMAEYYAQRAGAGLIVAEGSWPSPAGQAYCRQPGISSARQIEAWRWVTEAVHARGGRIVLQLMHSGRIGSHHIKPAGVETVSASALQAAGEIWTDAAGMQPFDIPRALSTEEVEVVINEHAQAASNAMTAGFDGVELHGTSGYLAMQFLSSSTNQRSDAYGGPAAARARFAVECLRAMGAAIGAGRVGLRVNPGNTYNDTADEDSAATHAELIRQASSLGLAYLHVMKSPLTSAWAVPTWTCGAQAMASAMKVAASMAQCLSCRARRAAMVAAGQRAKRCIHHRSACPSGRAGLWLLG